MKEDRVQNAILKLVNDPEFTGPVLSALDRVNISNRQNQKRIEEWVGANPLVVVLMEGAATELLKRNYGIPWYSKSHNGDRTVCAKFLKFPNSPRRTEM
jgi:hypothetical protein